MIGSDLPLQPSSRERLAREKEDDLEVLKQPLRWGRLLLCRRIATSERLQLRLRGGCLRYRFQWRRIMAGGHRRAAGRALPEEISKTESRRVIANTRCMSG